MVGLCGFLVWVVEEVFVGGCVCVEGGGEWYYDVFVVG